MENYYKGKNVEEPLERDKIPIPGLPENFIWMQVSGGSKLRNLLGYALKAFKDEQAIVWSGSGPGLSKAISCVEIMKRRYKQTYQLNKICFRKVEEFWEPQIKDLDPLVVVRDIPTIHILLSKDPLDVNEPGYQSPMSSPLCPRPAQESFCNASTENGTVHAPLRKPKSARVLGHFAPKVFHSTPSKHSEVNSCTVSHSEDSFEKHM